MCGANQSLRPHTASRAVRGGASPAVHRLTGGANPRWHPAKCQAAPCLEERRGAWIERTAIACVRFGDRLLTILHATVSPHAPLPISRIRPAYPMALPSVGGVQRPIDVRTHRSRKFASLGPFSHSIRTHRLLPPMFRPPIAHIHRARLPQREPFTREPLTQPMASHIHSFVHTRTSKTGPCGARPNGQC